MNKYILIFIIILIIFKYYFLSIILIIFLIYIYINEEIKNLNLTHKSPNDSLFKKNYYNELLVIYNLYNTTKKNIRNNMRSTNKNMHK